MLTPKDLEKYHQAAERILNAMDNSPVPISWHEMDRMALQSVIAKELILIDKEATLYNASGCKDKTAHDAICSASKPQTQVFRSDWTRRDNEADMFVKMVKRLAKGFNFKLCDRIRFEDPETGKKYL